ncbi:GGDEF domain-containing protein [Kineococcus rubinsiae]|uniref:GGDEF domain-containing protein n=1 Tax=Kineococcus rubinsiae TaxID=2609562 RepID=UPI001430D516|nr:GGDEF domain-containing protein [Kineococcus rubinsiae]NIZ93088.1 GGDEF domain-containing protein [Kineococcus rubinsiae]
MRRHRISHRFLDPALETRFRRAGVPALRRDLQALCFFIVGWHVLLITTTVLRDRDAALAAAHAADDAGLLVLGVVGLVLLRRIERLGPLIALTAVTACAFTGVVAAVLALADGYAVQGAVLLTLVACALHLVVGLPLWWAVGLGTGCTLATTAAWLSRPDVGLTQATVSAAASVLMVNALCALGGRRSRAAHRDLFASRELMALAATRDPLTGLANRRAALEHLHRTWAQCAERGLPYSVVVLDVDRFKEVNDLGGHAYGDEVLTVLAGVLAPTLAGCDPLLARYGGEEFVLLLPGVDTPEAAGVAERVVLAVREAALLRPAGGDPGQPRHLTLSAGAAGTGRVSGSPEVLLALADAELFHAKRAGRDGWRCTDADPDPGRTVLLGAIVEDSGSPRV